MRSKRMKQQMRMRMYIRNIAAAILAIVFISNNALVKASDQSDVRATVQSVFEQLKSRNYDALYDFLPGASRNRMSRDRFVNALQRAQDFYQLDRMEIGAIKVMGNLAVVDTVLYGRVVIRFRRTGRSSCSSICCVKMESGAWPRVINQR